MLPCSAIQGGRGYVFKRVETFDDSLPTFEIMDHPVGINEVCEAHSSGVGREERKRRA